MAKENEQNSTENVEVIEPIQIIKEDIKGTEIKPMEVSVQSKPDSLLELALTKGLDIVVIERLMALKERYDENEAKKSFFDAFTNFQMECPVLKKTKKVAYKDTKYYFAPLSEITGTIRETLHKNGLSYRWEFEDTEEKMTCHCILTHIDGHSEKSKMTSAKDTSGSKNDIQAIGSARQYMQRYTLLAVLGISTADEDTDAIVPELKDKFEKAIQLWKHTDYIKSVEKSLQGATDYGIFLENLPQQKHTEKLLQLLKDSPSFDTPKTWEIFQKQNKTSIDDCLIQLETVINKKKEK
jgi:hypothetical protein